VLKEIHNALIEIDDDKSNENLEKIFIPLFEAANEVKKESKKYNY